MDGWLQDLRFAGRRLVRHPLLSLTAIAALALGISASSAVFSIIHGVLLEPLPVAEPDRLLYLVSTRVDRGGHYTVVYPSFAGWRRARSFEHLIATRETTRVLTRANEAERLASTAVPAEYFEVLGVEPALGRPFADDERGVVLLSHALWQQRFGGTPDVLGQSIELDGEAHSVIGVMPPGLRSTFLGWKDLWTPLVVDETAALAEPLRGLRVLGRLAEGVSLTDARRELESLAAQMETDDPSRHQGWRAAMHPVAWWITGDAEKPLWWVFAASLLVLLIAGATVSNLLHALAATRRREIAVRRALGAGRSLLVRQMLLEGLVLSLVGGLAGVG
ncbi:MAG: ABC transporter permease, partial [Acidobacteriota bacterium]